MIIFGLWFIFIILGMMLYLTDYKDYEARKILKVLLFIIFVAICILNRIHEYCKCLI